MHLLRLTICLSFLAACVLSANSASLQTFAVVYGQVTNDIFTIENSFDASTATKQKLAIFSRARAIMLDSTLSDEAALAELVAVLGSNNDYAPLLDESANNARSALLSRYAVLRERVSLLPPSVRTTRARSSYNGLATAVSELTAAQRAAAISADLAPLGVRLTRTTMLVDRASVLPRPNIGLNRVRATINHRVFFSGATGRHSPNLFSVTSPGTFYREIYIRAVDGTKVLTINMPTVTSTLHYDVAQGFAAVSFVPNVFSTNATPVSVNNGTFWVQSTRREVYGIFSGTGPDLLVTAGSFRVSVPKALWAE